MPAIGICFSGLLKSGFIFKGEADTAHELKSVFIFDGFIELWNYFFNIFLVKELANKFDPVYFV